VRQGPIDNFRDFVRGSIDGLAQDERSFWAKPVPF